ncbi:MAG: hypothetical protein ABIK62_00560 [candidate division WOR-3 bacterium]
MIRSIIKAFATICVVGMVALAVKANFQTTKDFRLDLPTAQSVQNFEERIRLTQELLNDGVLND